MTGPEFHSWLEFYRLYPFDDLHRIHRPAALIGRSMSGADTDDLIEWLQPYRDDRFSEAELRTMKTFGIKPR